MAVVAVHAANPLVKHPAAHERAHLIILIPNLAVRIEGVGLIHNGELMMIEKLVAGLGIAGELSPAGMAGGAVIKLLLAGKRAQGGVF